MNGLVLGGRSGNPTVSTNLRACEHFVNKNERLCNLVLFGYMLSGSNWK
jgi:hypothetical protein